MITPVPAQRKALQLFVALQCVDLITTLTFLRQGTPEGNPLIHWALAHALAPWIALIATKGMAAMVGHYCYRKGRTTLLRRANIGYCLVVGWNLIAITAAMVA